MTHEQEKERHTERWIFAKRMIHGEDGTGYNPNWFLESHGNIVGEVAMWDWEDDEPLMRSSDGYPLGRYKTVNRTKGA